MLRCGDYKAGNNIYLYFDVEFSIIKNDLIFQNLLLYLIVLRTCSYILLVTYINMDTTKLETNFNNTINEITNWFEETKD